MGWISIYHSHRSGRAVCPERYATGQSSSGSAQVKAVCLTVVLLGMTSLFCCLPISQAEENGERKLIARVEPNYPETLQRLYIGGVVRLEITIAAKGNVESVTLLGGNPILGQSAMVAAKKWRYAPANSRTVTEVKISFDPHR
jgi:TonB family protein